MDCRCADKAAEAADCAPDDDHSERVLVCRAGFHAREVSQLEQTSLRLLF